MGAVAAYLQGDIVVVELLVHHGRCLAAEDAEGLVPGLPDDLRDELVRRLDGFPDTEEAGRGCGSFGSRCGAAA